MKNNGKAKTISPSSTKTSGSSARLLHANKTLLVDIDAIHANLGGQPILQDVSFCVHSGEFVGIIGPNGAGKTTLLRVLLGLLKPQAGRATVTAGTIGYIPQRGQYAGDSIVPMGVLEVARLGSRHGAEQALRQVGMADFGHRRFSELSGGQQQRVLIAKALAAQPALLILDEPTTGIDETAQVEFYQILADLKVKGIAVIMVSHDIDAVLKQVTRVICLNRTVQYDGPPEEFEAPKYLPSFYTAQHRMLHHHHEGSHA